MLYGRRSVKCPLYPCLPSPFLIVAMHYFTLLNYLSPLASYLAAVFLGIMPNFANVLFESHRLSSNLPYYLDGITKSLQLDMTGLTFSNFS